MTQTEPKGGGDALKNLLHAKRHEVQNIRETMLKSTLKCSKNAKLYQK